ncbi:hypothetical protein U1Q18_045863 [Sarracenia purpurea var. burkii]
MIRLVSVGNLEAAVSLLLSTHPDSMHFYANALRAVALSSAVSRSLLELAVKVVAANMVRTDRSLSGMHLLCAVGRYQEACSQVQSYFLNPFFLVSYLSNQLQIMSTVKGLFFGFLCYSSYGSRDITSLELQFSIDGGIKLSLWVSFYGKML